MKNIFLLAKQFYRNKVLLIFSILFYIISLGSIVSGIISCSQANAEPLDYLLQSLSVSLFTFVYFLFVSNEYLYKIKQCDVEETLRCISNGYSSFYLIGFLILMASALIFTAIVLAVNIIIYSILDLNNADYLGHIIKNILLNIFCVSTIAVFAGGLLSCIKTRIISYICMIFIIFMSSPLFQMIAGGVYAGTNINIYPVCDFFDIFPPLLKWAPIHTFGYSLLQYRIELIAFWSLILLSILTALIFARKRKKYLILSVFCLGLSLICLIGYFQPSSKITMSKDPATGALADAYYYREHAGFETTPSDTFTVKKYSLDLKIDKNLQAVATLELEKSELTQYNFTLYHGYTVESVWDMHKNKLNFTQTGDYISINTGNTPLTEITICYSGSAVKFFSNSQGICLPGWFAYYPHPGQLSLFDSEQQSFERILCPDDTEFQLTVNTPQKVYCNLEKNESNVFSGCSSGITLVSGFYDSCSYNNLEIIFPSLSTNEFSYEKIMSAADEYTKSGIFKENHKKIIVLPNTNMGSVYERFCEFSDHITLQQLTGLPLVYEMQKIPSYKSSLYNAYNTYKTDSEFFNFIVADRDDNGTDAYVLLDKALHQLDESYVDEHVTNYLNDDSDRRQGYVFLNDLLR